MGGDVKLRRAYELLEPFKVGGSSSGGASFFHSLVDEFTPLPLNPLNELNLRIPSFITTI